MLFFLPQTDHRLITLIQQGQALPKVSGPSHGLTFYLLSVCVYVSVELQVTPWPRTSAVFTCFCKRKALTVTTFLEKYDTRVIEGGGGG